MQPGTQLGHYEILEAIGKGGMGEVWRAKDTKLGREVAIKTLPPEFAEDPDRLARFEREAKLLASLNHPNIAAIHGFEHDEGTHFLVMELVEGDTLGDRIKRGAIPVEESLRLALQIADALKAAHESGVIHRDLKPDNIKVSEDGNIKVLDFGLAKAMAADETDVSVSNSPTLSFAATQAGMILGTAAYMSPEQAKGRAVDRRADVWAFGCVLYEMLTGCQSFGASDVTESLAAVISLPPKWDSLPSDLHPRLRETVERCLEKQVAKRYQDIGDAKVDIDRVLADPAGVTLRPVADTVGATSPSKRGWVLAFGVGFLVAGALFWALMAYLPSAGPIRFHYPLPDDQRFTRVGRTVVSVSRDGSRFIYVANGQLWTRSMDTLEAQPIPGTAENPTAPFFSPDGDWVGYWSENQLKRIQLAGGASVPLTEAALPRGRPYWSDDGTVVWSQAEGIMSVSENGGSAQILIAPWENGPGFFETPQILPDGDTVLFATNTSEVWVQSIASGQREMLFAGSSPQYVSTGHLVYEVDGVLFAVPFDLDSLDVTDGAVAVVQGVARTIQAQFDVSATGTLVYVTGSVSPGGEERLALVDRTGATTLLNVEERDYSAPRISPGGTQIVLSAADQDGSGDLYLYDLSGTSEIQQLTFEGSNRDPIWTPDGESITFASNRAREGSFSLYQMRIDGTGTIDALTAAEDGETHEPESYSPDGTLSFRASSGGAAEDGGGFGGNWRIWTLGPGEGVDPELFVDIPGSTQRGSAFSPDGEWIAYHSDHEAGPDIYVESFPRTGTVPSQITQTDAALWPIWSHDGTRIVYRDGTGRLESLTEVDVNRVSTARVTSGSPQPLPIGVLNPPRHFDLGPDDETFVVVAVVDDATTTEASAPGIDVVVNWTDELLERVPLP